MFNNSVGRFVRDEINEIRGKHSDHSSRPAFYHQPPAAPPPVDPYSHTASSTAGFSQNPTYPKLTNHDEQNQRDRSVKSIRNEKYRLTSFSSSVIFGQNRIKSGECDRNGRRTWCCGNGDAQIESRGDSQQNCTSSFCFFSLSNNIERWVLFSRNFCITARWFSFNRKILLVYFKLSCRPMEI